MRDSCHNCPHELRQRPLRHARPRARVAPVHADEGSRGQLPLIPIRRGAGAWLEDFDGKRYLDAVSSWWVNLFGHANPRINAAVRAQLEALEQVILAGFTHEPVIALSEELTRARAAGTHALLLRRQRLVRGRSGGEDELPLLAQRRPHAPSAASSRSPTATTARPWARSRVGNVELYKEIYRPLLMDVITVPSPDCYERAPGVSWAEHSRAQFAHMEAALARARARELRGDRRAAGAVRGRHAHVRPGVSHAAARGLRPPPGAPHRR